MNDERATQTDQGKTTANVRGNRVDAPHPGLGLPGGVSWPSGSMGAVATGGGTEFTAFATTAHTCSVRLFDAEGRAKATHRMEPRGHGVFHGRVEHVGPGALYKFVLDDRELPDPYARFLPHGVDGPAMVMQPRHEFRHECVSRPLREHVFYELHVGTFSEEGTYDGVRRRLPELAALGVTAIQLMPVASFNGNRGWGYDGVALYAPHAAYGTPDQLRALIDDAHASGLAVFLDVVYNHFGPAGNYLAAYSDRYFTDDFCNGWGAAPDYRHPAMRRYAIDNAVYWLREFRFDGLRLDATHALWDPSPRHVLSELVGEVATLSPRRLLVAEDERNDPRLVSDHGLDGVWADDFHHQLRVTLTSERDGYFGAYRPGVNGLAEVIRRGWLYEGQIYPPSGHPRGASASALPAEAFITCIQNHDQIGNRAMGERLNHDVSPEAFRGASTLLLFLPMTPLLFMGQEWAASSPFQYFTDHGAELGAAVSRGRREEFKKFSAFCHPEARDRIPDPESPATFERSRLRWTERGQGEHGRTHALYQALLALRAHDPVLRVADRAAMRVATRGDLLIVDRRHGDDVRRLVVNFGPQPVEISELGSWHDGVPALSRVLLRSEQPEGGGGAALGPHEAVIFG